MTSAGVNAAWLVRSPRLPWLVVGVTLAVLGGAIALTTQQLRNRIRTQIAGRDAEVLHAVALMQQYEEDAGGHALGPIEDPLSQLTVLLKTSRLTGALAARLFDVGGVFVDAFPPEVREAQLDARDLPMLQSLNPVSRFHPAVRFDEIYLGVETNGASLDRALPLLEVNVPLHAGAGSRLSGIAQFLIEGESIAAEFARLDRHLALQALATFATGGGLLAATLGWAFRRLRRSHQLLEARTTDLLRANEELALAAKTTAVGAVTSHLIHGLKNPLAGLQSFVANLPQTPDKLPAEWQEAIASTRRMQALINQVVSVLAEEAGPSQYEVTLAELSNLVSARMQPLAQETGVQLEIQIGQEAVLPSRVANLAVLILVNLGQNALQATPRGKRVFLSFTQRDESIVCEVRDQGPGLPKGQAAHVFAPCRSAKPGGSGIGLAISKQLANHLGASLELRDDTSAGCVFVLTLPLLSRSGFQPDK